MTRSKFLIVVTLLTPLLGIGAATRVRAQNYNWTGFYVGAHAGFAKPKDVVKYRGSSSGVAFDADNQKIINRENGFAAGVQAGYNHQIGAFVPGIEADLGYMRFNDSRVSPAEFDPEQQTHAVSSGGLLGTVTGRFGAAIDCTLIYAKGGFAYSNLKLGVTDNVGPLTTDATACRT